MDSQMILDLDMIFAKQIPRVNDFGYWPASSENIANEPVVESFTVPLLRLSYVDAPLSFAKRGRTECRIIIVDTVMLGAWWLIR
jgi:hypothetical protein